MTDVEVQLQIQKVGLLTKQNAEGIAQLIEMNKVDVKEMKDINKNSIERLERVHRQEMTEIRGMLKTSACSKNTCENIQDRLKSLEHIRNVTLFIIGSSFLTAVLSLVYKSEYLG